MDRYAALRAAHPELFANPPDAPIEILTEPLDVRAAETAAAGALEAAGQPAAWAVTGVVYEDPYDLVLRDPVRRSDGSLGTYVRRIKAGAAPGVVVLPVLDGRVLLIRHFRHATRRWHWEIPRGYGTPGADPADDARRELSEEIGAEALALHPLGVTYPDTGESGTPVHLFLAGVDRYGAPESGEAIDAVRPVPPAELAAMIAAGAIEDGYTIAAWARAVLLKHLPG